MTWERLYCVVVVILALLNCVVLYVRSFVLVSSSSNNQSRAGTIFAIFQVVPSSQLRYIYILPEVGDNAYIRTSFTYGMFLKKQGLQVLTNTG